MQAGISHSGVDVTWMYMYHTGVPRVLVLLLSIPTFAKAHGRRQQVRTQVLDPCHPSETQAEFQVSGFSLAHLGLLRVFGE